MKYIKKIPGILLLLLVIYSCDTNNEVTGYEPANYDFPKSFSINENVAAATDNSFEVVYTPSAAGKGYYIVLPAGSAEPTSTNVHNKNVNGILQAGTFDVDGSTPVNITISDGIFGDYDYDVYAIHKSTDDFISETVTKLTATTPDTMAPEFLPFSSFPAMETGDHDPFGEVYLLFTEPVFYQGGDITITGYYSGREIVVNDPAVLTSYNSLYQVITEHGTFAQDDFMVFSWDEGTFADKSGKPVAELSGFSYYFKTRLFTLQEQAFLMQGLYEYSTGFWGGAMEGFYYNNINLFLPETGEFELVLDPEDEEGLTLLGINIFSPLNQYGYDAEPDHLKIKLGEGGELQETGKTDSGVPTGEAMYWGHYSFFGTNYPGFWDFEAGTIEQWNTLYYASDDWPLDDVDYSYTRIGTYAKGNFAKGKTVSLEELKARSLKRKKEILNGQTIEYRHTEIILNK